MAPLVSIQSFSLRRTVLVGFVFGHWLDYVSAQGGFRYVWAPKTSIRGGYIPGGTGPKGGEARG